MWIVLLTFLCLCDVTGRSLVWVGLLGCVLFYIYALISFAFLRASFDPDSDMYCGSLWQCTVTVIRFGLIGDIFEVSRRPHFRLNSVLRLVVILVRLVVMLLERLVVAVLKVDLIDVVLVDSRYSICRALLS